jgi:hypothetical protein
MSREDLAIIFPKDNQFILGVKLYQLIQKMRKQVSTDLDASQESDIGSVLSSKRSSAQPSIKTLSRANTSSASFRSGGECSHSSNASQDPRPKKNKEIVPQTDISPISTESRKRPSGIACEEFSLPEFSPDVQQAIKADQFITSAKRNKLIREACRAYKGYCRSVRKDITSEGKRKLGRMLYGLAPKSLGDLEDLAVQGVPEASLNKQIVRWFQNNDHTDRKLCGKAKKHSKVSSKVAEIVEIPDSDDDEECVLAADHLKELRKDMDKGIKRWDIDKVSRLLSLTFKLRSQRKASNNQISQMLQEFPCFKEPGFVSIIMVSHRDLKVNLIG